MSSYYFNIGVIHTQQFIRSEMEHSQKWCYYRHASILLYTWSLVNCLHIHPHRTEPMHIFRIFFRLFFFCWGGREKLSMIVTLRWGNVTAGLPSSLKCCVPENTASEQIAVFYNFFHLKKFFKILHCSGNLWHSQRQRTEIVR